MRQDGRPGALPPYQFTGFLVVEETTFLEEFVGV
jgi:hypothetical protein